jgi:hypothetical protein
VAQRVFSAGNRALSGILIIALDVRPFGTGYGAGALTRKQCPESKDLEA